MKVFDIEEMGNAIVKNERLCTSCRECIRNPKFKDAIDLLKIKDHYECNYLNEFLLILFYLNF